MDTQTPTLDINSLRDELQHAAPPTRSPSPRSVIKSLMPLILKKREEGFTAEDLVAFFATKGLAIRKEALYVYISQHQRQQQKQAAPDPRPTSPAAVANPFRPAPAQPVAPGGFVHDYKDI